MFPANSFNNSFHCHFSPTNFGIARVLSCPILYTNSIRLNTHTYMVPTDLRPAAHVGATIHWLSALALLLWVQAPGQAGGPLRLHQERRNQQQLSHGAPEGEHCPFDSSINQPYLNRLPYVRLRYCTRKPIARRESTCHATTATTPVLRSGHSSHS